MATNSFPSDEGLNLKKQRFWEVLDTYFDKIAIAEGRSEFDGLSPVDDFAVLGEQASLMHAEGMTITNGSDVVEQRKYILDLTVGDGLVDVPLNTPLPYVVTQSGQPLPQPPPAHGFSTNLRTVTQLSADGGAHRAMIDLEPALCAGEMQFSYENDPISNNDLLVCTIDDSSGTYKQKEIGRIKYAIRALFDRGIVPDVIRLKKYDQALEKLVVLGEFKPRSSRSIEIDWNHTADVRVVPTMRATYFRKSSHPLVSKFFNSEADSKDARIVNEFGIVAQRIYRRFPRLSGNDWEKSTVDTALLRSFLLRNVGHLYPERANHFITIFSEAAQFGSEQALYRYLHSRKSGQSKMTDSELLSQNRTELLSLMETVDSKL